MYTNFASFAAYIASLLNKVVFMLAALAVVVFFWGIVHYLWDAGSERGKTKSREIFVWGLIALFVLFCVWGILNLFCITFFQSAECSQNFQIPSGNDFGNPNFSFPTHV